VNVAAGRQYKPLQVRICSTQTILSLSGTTASMRPIFHCCGGRLSF